jgi:Uma2 family endonuclease
MTTTDNSTSDPFERWWATTPQSKLELIDGRLIISTLAGSRRIAWYLLRDYGPAMAIPMAAPDLWWEALYQAFNPRPRPSTAEEWATWADTVEHDPEPPPAGPHGSVAHRHVFSLLQMGLHRFAEVSGSGHSLGRDFVMRLGEDGLTPDLLFVGRSSLARLHNSYFDGPPSLVIEITLEGSEEQDRVLKRRLYEQAGIPEYWLVEAAVEEVLFLRLGEDGRYHPAVADDQAVYRSTAVPDLALSLAHLWTMNETDWDQPCLPFLPPLHKEDGSWPERRRDDELGWDSLPFAPRVGLQPVPIEFAEYISWGPEAKFEYLGGGLVIGGDEGSRRCLGMLLMTLGLVEVVKLATPREWVAFLNQEPYQALVQERTEALMAQARYESQNWSGDHSCVIGEIPQIPSVSVYEGTLEESQRALRAAVRNWVLLRIARRLDPSDIDQ